MRLTSQTGGIYPSGAAIAGRYEVRIGPHERSSLRGGMGLVYLCLDHQTDTPVALKTFRPELLSSRNGRDRFLREGTTWVELGRHLHIVRAHRVHYTDEGREIYLVLDWVTELEGKRDSSLGARLTSGARIPCDQALLFALHIVRGMRHATQRISGLVHRDLKPANVLVGHDGNARVTDFGLAAVLSESEDGDLPAQNEPLAQKRLLTYSRGFAGTPEYASPEQFDGRQLDERSDHYALGCMLFEMLTGRLPFSTHYRSGDERLARCRHNHLHEIPSSPREVVPSLPREVETLVMRCLEKPPAARYPDWNNLEAATASAYYALTGRSAPDAPGPVEETHAERVEAGWTLNSIGQSYVDISKYGVAIQYFERVLEIAKAERSPKLEGAALNNMGNCYQHTGDFTRSIALFERHVALARNIGDLEGEGKSLGNLGLTYRSMGDATRAVSYHEQHLAIARARHDSGGESIALGNLGVAYLNLGDPRRAIAMFERELEILRETGNRPSQGNSLGNLGSAYLDLGDARRAIDLFREHLAIAREFANRAGEGNALGGIGSAHHMLREFKLAIDFSEQSLLIAREISDLSGEAKALGNLGIAHKALGDLAKAIGFFEQDLALQRKIGDRHAECRTLGNLGNTYLQLGNAQQALEYWERRLAISDEIGDELGGAITRMNRAILRSRQGSNGEALGDAQKASQVFEKVGHATYLKMMQQLIAALKGATPDRG